MTGNPLPPELLVGALGDQLVLKKDEIRAKMTQRIATLEFRLAELKKRKAQIQNQSGAPLPAVDDLAVSQDDQIPDGTDGWLDVGGSDEWNTLGDSPTEGSAQGDAIPDVSDSSFTDIGGEASNDDWMSFDDGGDDLTILPPTPDGETGNDNWADFGDDAKSELGDLSDLTIGTDNVAPPDGTLDVDTTVKNSDIPDEPLVFDDLPDVNQLIDDADDITRGLAL